MSIARILVVVALLVALGAVLVLLVLPERDADDAAVPPRPEKAGPEPDADTRLRGNPVSVDPTPQGEDPTPPPDVEPQEGEVLLRGRVVDPDGRPAPNAEIEVAHEHGVVARGVGAADGTFAIRVSTDVLEGTWNGRLLAADARGHRAAHFVFWGTNLDNPIIEVGLVRLLRAYALEVEVRFPAEASPPATVHAEVKNAGHSFLLALGTYRTDEDGRLRLEKLPEGTLRILATAEGSGRGAAYVTLPQEEPQTLVIDLPAEHVVTVDVVDAQTQAPIEGAVLAASEYIQAPGTSFVTSADLWPPLSPSTTDAEGRLVMRGLSADQSVRLVANAEGYPHVPANATFGTARVDEDTTSVRIELPRPRTVRWPIEDGPVPRPAEAARIVIRPSAGSYLANEQIPSEGRIESAELVVEGWPPGFLHGQAVAPDGSIARLYAKGDTDTGNPVTFFPARRVEAVVRYAGGEPAEGFYVNLRNQGNNPIGTPARTDAEGRAVIEGLYGGTHSLLQVHLSETSAPWSGVLLGTVDLEKGDGYLEGTVERVREAVLRFTIDGTPRLPLDPRVDLGLPGRRSPERDEEAAELRLAWRPRPAEARTRLGVEAEGLLPFSMEVDVPPVGTPLVVDVALETAGAFLVRVTMPADGSVRVTPQRWDTEKGAWTGRIWLPMTRMGGFAKPDANGLIRFTPLAAGRYRAVDTVAGIATDPVDLTPGGADPEVILDAGNSGWARGKVVLPDGTTNALVRADGLEGVVAHVREDGTFQVRVPGDREVVLRAEAPTLRPHVTRGSLRVTTPRDDLVLELVRDHLATLRLGQAIPNYNYLAGPGRVLTRTVLLYVGKAQGEPALRTDAIVQEEGRALSFGGFEPGTYTIWVDANPFAPVELSERVLGEGATDLGEVPVSEGARVVIELLVAEGQAAPRAYARATREEEPAYLRSVNWRGPHGVLKGLAPGPHRITVGSHMDGSLRHAETIDFAEGEEKRITIDLR